MITLLIAYALMTPGKYGQAEFDVSVDDIQVGYMIDDHPYAKCMVFFKRQVQGLDWVLTRETCKNIHDRMRQELHR